MEAHKRGIRKADGVVLILCLGLLLSSFAAVGQQGRQRAREAVCLANQRQWHAVFQNYLANHDGTFFTGDAGTGFWWPIQLDEATQSWKQNRTWFCPVAARPLYKEGDSTMSGSAQDSAWGIYDQQDYSRLGPDGIAGSYGLNGYAIDISNSGSRFQSSRVSATDGWQDFDNVTVADKVPLFLGAARFDLWPLPGDAPGQQDALLPAGANMAHCCIDRHGGAVNCLFLDGSARKVGLKELWTLKWHRSFNTDGPWTLAGGVQSTDWPEWLREFKDY